MGRNDEAARRRRHITFSEQTEEDERTNERTNEHGNIRIMPSSIPHARLHTPGVNGEPRVGGGGGKYCYNLR